MNKTSTYKFTNMYEESVMIEALVIRLKGFSVAGHVLERGQSCNGLKSPAGQSK